MREKINYEFSEKRKEQADVSLRKKLLLPAMINECLKCSLDPSQLCNCNLCKIKSAILTNKHKRILVDKGIILTHQVNSALVSLIILQVQSVLRKQIKKNLPRNNIYKMMRNVAVASSTRNLYLIFFNRFISFWSENISSPSCRCGGGGPIRGYWERNYLRRNHRSENRQ